MQFASASILSPMDNMAKMYSSVRSTDLDILVSFNSDNLNTRSSFLGAEMKTWNATRPNLIYGYEDFDARVIHPADLDIAHISANFPNFTSILHK